MGWSFEVKPRPRAEFVEWLTRHAEAKHDAGDHIWTVERIDDGRKLVVCYLIETLRGGWGYKTVSEDMGPYEFDCPVELLDQASPAGFGTYSMEWRTEVRRRALPKQPEVIGRVTAEGSWRVFDPADCGGAFDGVSTVYSDADSGL